jgi:SAM-dependent methyltransferase
MDLNDALQKSRTYFRDKITEHGPVPQGVDFNGQAAQSIRFDQLIRIIDPSRRFNLIDYGCGYGALLSHLRKLDWDFTYWGYDELDAMVEAARSEYGESDKVRFTTDLADVPECDYLIAGSIFNIKFDVPVETWRDHTLTVLRRMNSLCTRALSFDILTIYSDPDRMALRPDLYFADPLFYFDFCKRTLALDVALLHDYGLYDFTIMVRKQQ